MVAQHNPADARVSALPSSACFGFPSYRRRRARGDRQSARTGSTDSASSTAPTIPPATLPYGAQRRLEIARAMCTDPVLLCLDEPAAGLNPRESAELNELLLFDRATNARSRSCSSSTTCRW